MSTQIKLGEVGPASTDTTDAPNENDDSDDRDIRQRVIDGVGNGGDLGEYDVEGTVAGDAEVIMWFPDDEDDPMGIPVDEFEGDTEWDIGYTEIGDNDETVAVIGVTNGEKRHIIDIERLYDVCYELDVRPKELLSDAKIHDDYANYPVVIELDTGRLMVAPIMKSWDEVRRQR